MNRHSQIYCVEPRENSTRPVVEVHLAPPGRKKIRVGIIASSRLVRDYLGSIAEQNMELAFSIAEVALLEKHEPPQILLVDARDCDHFTIVALGKRSPEIKLIVIDADCDGLNLVECAQIGVSGFTLKDSGRDKITETIQTLNDNQKVIPSKIMGRLYEQVAMGNERSARFGNADLTVREHQIASLMAQGLTNKEIAQRLNIAAHTAKTHVHNILRKVGCRRRVDLLRAERSDLAGRGGLETRCG